MKVRVTVTEQIGSGTAPESTVTDRLIQTESHKRLTGKRAAAILAREFPELRNPIVIKTERGWRGSVAVKSTEKCSYRFVWRHYYVSNPKS